MPTRFRSILIILTRVQLLALECLNETWIERHNPMTLTTYIPAQRRAHAPIRRAAAWARTGDPRAQAIQRGVYEPLCLLMGEELIYWDEHGADLFIPGIPGMIEVVVDDAPPPAVDLGGETRPYYTVSGVVAIRPASDGLSAGMGVSDAQLVYELLILEADPATLDGLDI